MNNDKLQQHIQTLNERIPPVVNVNCVIYKKHPDGTLYDPEIFVGRRINDITEGKRIFPGSRLQISESPSESTLRIIEKECHGLDIIPKKLITAITTDNDVRSRNCNLYYLCEYVGGEYAGSDTFEDHQWISLNNLDGLDNLRPTDQLAIEDIKQTISMVNSNQDEILVEVDMNDQEIGTISKKEAHSTNLRSHRAAHIFVFTSDGKTVLQQRSRNKASSPLRRDMHGGHQTSGQTIDQCAAAELSEEVGITGELTFHHSKYFSKTKQSEFAHVYTIVHDGPYGYDSNEVAQLGTFDCQKILDGGYDTEYDIMPHVKTYLIELEDIWKPLVKKI